MLACCGGGVLQGREQYSHAVKTPLLLRAQAQVGSNGGAQDDDENGYTDEDHDFLLPLP